MSTNQANLTQTVDRHPNLSTAEDQFSWLMAVQKITRIFSEKTKYDFNPIELLADQHKLVKELRQIPLYTGAMVEKKYEDISITPPKEGFAYSDAQIKPEAIEAWKKHLKEVQMELGSQSMAAAIEELQKALQQEPGKSNLFKQSVHALTNPNVKDRVHNQTIYNAIKQKNPSNFPQEILKKWEDFRGVDQNLRNDFEVLAKELKLCDLLELSLVSANKPVLDDLDVHDLIYFSDTQDVIVPGLASFKGLENQKALSLAIAKRIESYASQTTSTAKITKDPITLVQALPAAAIFRGCAGGDCSSFHSFPYPNAPNERVFFIYDKEKKLKGYVSVVEVTVNGESALYVITINGSRVGAADAEMIFQGLEAKKEQLGVKHIVLPIPSNIGDLLNFPAPTAVYKKYTNGQPLVPIAYKDLEVRRAIEAFPSSYNSGDYDRMSHNTQGVIFKPKKNQKLIVDIQPGVPTIKAKNLSEASPAEIVELLIPMHLTEKDDVMNQMLEIEKVAEKISQAAFKVFAAQLDNEVNLATSEWKKHLQDSLEKLNIEEDFLEKQHPEFFYPGLLRSEDAFSSENIENTAKAMVVDMRSNQLEPRHFKLFHFSEEVQQKLRETSAFKHFGSFAEEQLREESREKRCLAMDTLGRIKPTALLTFLEDQDPGVRCAVLKVLGQVRPTDVEIHQALVIALKDKDWQVADTAAEALSQIKPAALDIHRALAVLLEDPDGYVCCQAAKILSKIKPADVEIHRALAKCLKDEKSESLRLAVTKALSEIKPADVEIHQALVIALKDKEWQVRQAAAEALGEIKPADVEIHKALALALKDEDWQVRRTAAQALGKIRPADVEIHKALVVALKDEDWQVRQAAAEALGEIKPADVEIHQALAELLKDPDEEVRLVAIWSLGDTAPTDVEIHQALVVALKDKDWQVRQAVAEALGEIKPAAVEIHKALVIALKDKKWKVRQAVAEALGQIKPTDVEIHKALVMALCDKEWNVCQAATEALGQIQPTDVEVYQALLIALKEKEWYIRQAVAVVLGKIKPTDVEIHQALVVALKDKDWQVRQAVAEALGEIQPADVEAHQALEIALKDEDLQVREAAAGALSKIQSAGMMIESLWSSPRREER